MLDLPLIFNIIKAKAPGSNIEDIGIVTMRHRDGTISNLLNTCMVPCGDVFHLEVATLTHYIALNQSDELTVEKGGMNRPVRLPLPSE